MKIRMISPAPSRSLYGNSITSLRWQGILEELGHRVEVTQKYGGEPCDLLVALHAKKSSQAVFRFREAYHDKPIIVALTGTDVYRDMRLSARARRAIGLATRLIVLQPLAVQELPPGMRRKARVIFQSAEKTDNAKNRSSRFFDVCVVGHLRAVKDPFRAAYASRLLPAGSKIRVFHLGDARDRALAAKARTEQNRNPRYRWLGSKSHAETLRHIAASRLLVLSSRMEGGANVISEAVANRVPILASRIPGTLGLLGRYYPGYFPVGDTRSLADLLLKSEQDRAFYSRLKAHCSTLAPLFRPSYEKQAWMELLEELRLKASRVE
ncbi:MAG TPA: selenoneine biosynthesis selenosugar synthase SenB [Acidobacteriota bacterium]|jgi:putative glycosyltransferase (TIGR04348 family)